MLATALHELLPEAIEKGGTKALAGVGLGFLALYTVERLTHFHACRHRACEIHNDDHAHGHVHTHASTTLMGIGLHNFIDGLITAAAFAVSHVAGALVLGAIVIHQVAVGFSIGALLLRAGRTQRQVAISTAVTGSFILWGALAYAVLPVSELVAGFLLGVAGGTFLYIGACDLLPEAHEKDEGVFVMSSTLVGYGLAFAMTQLFSHHH
jgi:zinc and cadmium transporter